MSDTVYDVGIQVDADGEPRVFVSVETSEVELDDDSARRTREMTPDEFKRLWPDTTIKVTEFQRRGPDERIWVSHEIMPKAISIQPLSYNYNKTTLTDVHGITERVKSLVEEYFYDEKQEQNDDNN